MRRIVSADPNPQPGGDHRHRVVALGECPAGGVGPDPFDIGARRLTGLVGEDAGEMTRAHRRVAGEIVDAMHPARLGLDAFLDLADRRAPGPRHPHRRGELALTTWAPHVEDEPPRDELCELGAVVLLDEGQREVDTGGDARGTPHPVAAAHEQGLGVDLDRRVSLGEQPGHGPVRRRAFAVEEAGLGGEERAVAHADDASCPLRRPSDPVDEVGVAGGVVDAGAAGQDQDVERLGRVGQRLRDELQPDAGAHRQTGLRHQPQVVADLRALVGDGIRRGGQHVGRSGHVQGLHPGVSEDQHRSSHEDIVSDPHRGVQATHPTDQDTSLLIELVPTAG